MTNLTPTFLCVLLEMIGFVATADVCYLVENQSIFVIVLWHGAQTTMGSHGQTKDFVSLH